MGPPIISQPTVMMIGITATKAGIPKIVLKAIKCNNKAQCFRMNTSVSVGCTVLFPVLFLCQPQAVQQSMNVINIIYARYVSCGIPLRPTHYHVGCHIILKAYGIKQARNH
jgi:xanthine/uracil permease